MDMFHKFVIFLNTGNVKKIQLWLCEVRLKRVSFGIIQVLSDSVKEEAFEWNRISTVFPGLQPHVAVLFQRLAGCGFNISKQLWSLYQMKFLVIFQ